MHRKIQKDNQFLKQKQNCTNAKGMNKNKHEKCRPLSRQNIIKQME